MLKANNPLYANIKIIDDWVENAIANDEELVMTMLKQDESMAPLFQTCHLVLNWNTLNCNKKMGVFYKHHLLFACHTSNHGYLTHC